MLFIIRLSRLPNQKKISVFSRKIDLKSKQHTRSCKSQFEEL